MKKKFMIVVVFTISIILLTSQSLPSPKNDQLYTDFVSYKYAKYLKRPIKTTGYIVMNGKEKILYKQLNPVQIEIRKINETIIYKKKGIDPIEMDITSENNDLFFLFVDQNIIQNNFNIKKNKTTNKDEYIVTPKNINKIKKILIIAIEDKIEKLEIIIDENNRIIYEFYNIITGIVPNEKYFKE